jgi:hypothetical protein
VTGESREDRTAHPTSPEPRAHHFVPQCWLSGFTETGHKSGRLSVTDLKRRKQWPSTPAESGHRRDFYRLSAPHPDPVLVEKMLSKIEDGIAPLLKVLDDEQRGPNEDELEGLLGFMAIQWVRVPAFRPTILRIADSIHRAKFSEYLRSPESWARMLKEADIPAGSPGADYEQMREFERSGEYSLSAETEWYLMRAFEGAKTIIPLLMARHWGVSISRKGSFIGSDNPVVLDGPKGGMVGFKNAEVVVYPVSRHILLYGTKQVERSPFVNQMYIARQNTFMMLTAEEQVFSSTPNFCWLDETDGYQTDWRLFSKEKFL